MRLLLFLTLLAASGPAAAQPDTGKRLTGLEKRVNKVEKRVTRLEQGGTPPAPAAAIKPPENPITASFVKKKQVLGQDKMGLKLYVELENVSNRHYFAFNGTMVFRNDTGAVIWSRAYGYSEPIAPGEKVEVALTISSEQAKEYLRVVKARGISVTLEKQEAYAAD